MNDIDFIKKCCEYAEGFTLNDDYTISLPSGACFFKAETLLNSKTWKTIYCPLLIQKAVEGFNKKAMEKGEDLYIIINPDCLEYFDVNIQTKRREPVRIFIDEVESIDKAKRVALENVFESIS